MEYLLLFSAFSEWIEKNIFQIVSAVLVAIGAIIWLIRLEGSVKNMCDKLVEIDERVEETQSEFITHTKDKDAHVNHLYMASLKERLVKLESAVEIGNQRIEQKLDKLTDKIYQHR